jgi:hypothetical protein
VNRKGKEEKNRIEERRGKKNEAFIALQRESSFSLLRRRTKAEKKK